MPLNSSHGASAIDPTNGGYSAYAARPMRNGCFSDSEETSNLESGAMKANSNAKSRTPETPGFLRDSALKNRLEAILCGVVRGGVEPPTHGFSVPTSKNGKSSKNAGKTGHFDDFDLTENCPCQQKAGCFASATINPKQSLISAILKQLVELDLSKLKTVHDMIALIHADFFKTKVS